jgi:hypothetical protein
MPFAVTDVENPADPALTKALAPAGATSGLVCRYATDNVMHFSPGANTDVDTPAPMPVPNLRGSAVLSAAQAASLSKAAAATSIAPAIGSYSCPSGDFGHVALVLLGYSDRADVDVWYSDTGCQVADNGYVSAFLLAGGDFGSAVDGLVPRPSSGPATPSAST